MRDQFIQETLEQLKTYDLAGTCSFENLWLLKSLYNKKNEDKYLSNPGNSFLLYMFTCDKNCQTFVENVCNKLRTYIKIQLNQKDQAIYREMK